MCGECLGKVQTVGSICPVCTRGAVGGETHPKCEGRYAMDGLTCGWRYQGVVRRAIGQIKYRFRYRMAEELVYRLSQEIERRDREFLVIRKFIGQKPVLVPVPVHWVRENWRGFNQAEILAKEFAKIYDLRLVNLLIRKRWTGSQVGRDREGRIENIKGVMAISRRSQDSISTLNSVLLVDDVWTTGATMRECAGVLKRNGVKKVWGLTMAR